MMETTSFSETHRGYSWQRLSRSANSGNITNRDVLLLVRCVSGVRQHGFGHIWRRKGVIEGRLKRRGDDEEDLAATG
jgi:hypothetical protein